MFNFVDELLDLSSDYNFDIELDFDMMGIEQEEIYDDEVPRRSKDGSKINPNPTLNKPPLSISKLQKIPKKSKSRTTLPKPKE